MTLLIDAYDTLWEKLIVFRRVNAAYIDWIAPNDDPTLIAVELDHIQVSLVQTHGYGRRTFELSHHFDAIEILEEHSRLLRLPKFGALVEHF